MQPIILSYDESEQAEIKVILINRKTYREKIGIIKYKLWYDAMPRALEELKKLNIDINKISFMELNYFNFLSKDDKTI